MIEAFFAQDFFHNTKVLDFVKICNILKVPLHLKFIDLFKDQELQGMKLLSYANTISLTPCRFSIKSQLSVLLPILNFIIKE